MKINKKSSAVVNDIMGKNFYKTKSNFVEIKKK